MTHGAGPAGTPELVGIAYQGPGGFETAWSGIPAGVAGGLRELGREAVVLNVDLPRALRSVARAWGRVAAGEARYGPLTPEARRLARTAVTLRRRRQARPALWIYCARAISDAPPPDGSVLATFADMPLTHALRENERVGALPPRVVRDMLRRQRAAYAAAAACCVASDWAADAVVADYGVPASKVHVVGFGRNCDPRPVPRDWTAPRFLFVGADWQRKNGDAVVRAFNRLRERVGAATLDVVGNHPPIGVDGVVEHGPLNLANASDQRRLVELFEQATCYVMPSRFEAFGMVYVEAGAAGVPSIGTTRGGAATAIGEGGILVDPEDDGALLAAMTELADAERAEELGHVAREHARPYTWRGVAERILAAAGARPA